MSLFLDYSVNGKRVKEYLNIILIKGEKKENVEKMREGETFRAQRQLDMSHDRQGLIIQSKQKKDFLEYWQEYLDKYHKGNRRMVQAALHKFQQFHSGPLYFNQLTESLFLDFQDYLNDTKRSGLSGETPFDYFSITKKILTDARKRKYLKDSPAEFIKNVFVGSKDLRKEVLFPDEIQLLVNSYCGIEEVKRASLFASQTGLRYCDIEPLQWKNIVMNPPYIRYEQAKGERRNDVPLNANAISLLGNKGEPSERVFKLNMSQTTVNKHIKKWVENAKIEKHITFHCFRHSFISNVLYATGNLKLASSLAGHTTTKHTEKYTHIVDNMKIEATDKLTKFKIDE